MASKKYGVEPDGGPNQRTDRDGAKDYLLFLPPFEPPPNSLNLSGKRDRLLGSLSARLCCAPKATDFKANYARANG